MGAAVEADTGASGYLSKARQQPLELGTLRDIYPIDQRRNEVVGIFEGRTDGSQVFLVLSCASGVAVLDLVEGSSDGFVFCRLANEFVISHSFLL